MNQPMRELVEAGKMVTDEKVSISLKHLNRISKYYEFPLAVFFSPSCVFPEKKTRRDVLFEKARIFDKIKELIDEEDKE